MNSTAAPWSRALLPVTAWWLRASRTCGRDRKFARRKAQAPPRRAGRTGAIPQRLRSVHEHFRAVHTPPGNDGIAEHFPGGGGGAGGFENPGGGPAEL